MNSRSKYFILFGVFDAFFRKSATSSNLGEQRIIHYSQSQSLDVRPRISAFLNIFSAKFEIDAVMYRCMTSDFVNNGNILGNFVEIIQNMSRQTAYFNTYSQNTYSRWPDGSLKVPTYYSPYIVMAQRSGTGKTRLLFELGRKALPVFYVCLSGPFKSSANICTFLDGLRYKDSFINVLALFASVGDFFLDKLRLEAADLQISCDLSTKSLTANERERIVWALSKYFIPTSEDDPEGFISQSFKDILGRVELWKHKPSLLDYVMERKGALEIRSKDEFILNLFFRG